MINNGYSKTTYYKNSSINLYDGQRLYMYVNYDSKNNTLTSELRSADYFNNVIVRDVFYPPTKESSNLTFNKQITMTWKSRYTNGSELINGKYIDSYLYSPTETTPFENAINSNRYGIFDTINIPASRNFTSWSHYRQYASFLGRTVPIDNVNGGYPMDTIKLKHKKLLLMVFTFLFCSITPVAAAKINTVPTYIKGYEISEKSSLPAIMYKDIVHIPLTYEYNKILGIELGENSISLNNKIDDSQTAWIISYDLKNQSDKITIPDKINLFGKSVNNKNSDYPVLFFRDCYYLPLTYDNLAKFNLKPEFDGKTFYAKPGLGRNTLPTSGIEGIQVNDITFGYSDINIGRIDFYVVKDRNNVDLSDKMKSMFDFTRINDRYYILINQTITTDGVSKNDKLGITVDGNFVHIPVTYLKDGSIHSKTLKLNLITMNFE